MNEQLRGGTAAVAETGRAPPMARPARARRAQARRMTRTTRRDADDTRARIQQVAVELFAEQGYDKTSLREIAERLDVTKAALYYHFKSKEDIVRSLVEDYIGQVDALIAWAKTQPRTPETRGEILSRYVQIVADGSDVFRMLHHNQAAVNSLAGAKERGERVPGADDRAGRGDHRARSRPAGAAAGHHGARQRERRLDVLLRPGEGPQRALRRRPRHRPRPGQGRPRGEPPPHPS